MSIKSKSIHILNNSVQQALSYCGHIQFNRGINLVNSELIDSLDLDGDGEDLKTVFKNVAVLLNHFQQYQPTVVRFYATTEGKNVCVVSDYFETNFDVNIMYHWFEAIPRATAVFVNRYEDFLEIHITHDGRLLTPFRQIEGQTISQFKFSELQEIFQISAMDIISAQLGTVDEILKKLSALFGLNLNVKWLDLAGKPEPEVQTFAVEI